MTLVVTPSYSKIHDFAHFNWEQPSAECFIESGKKYQIRNCARSSELYVERLSPYSSGLRGLFECFCSFFLAKINSRNRDELGDILRGEGIRAVGKASGNIFGRFQVNTKYRTNLHQFSMEKPKLFKQAKQQVDILRQVPKAESRLDINSSDSPIQHRCPISGYILNHTNAVVLEHNGQSLVVSRQGIRYQLLNDDPKFSKISRQMILDSQIKALTSENYNLSNFGEWLVGFLSSCSPLGVSKGKLADIVVV
ncbi:hypothetical protein D5018_06065 [Parashewanella curva]|uniref:Uncharacterized protein n=1 Tax=Parashewanella curva TaxID=2338552 RepID=A0A3L8PZ59_9GAMM|nr:hypothetical protein [Parashewanella curva]RLV60664.1 hypothetical protein D5018_06065 [Parashewanella curva]